MNDSLRRDSVISSTRHRRDTLWQIALPMVFVLVLILAAAVGVVLLAGGQGGQFQTIADISVIWLVLPNLIIAILYIALLGLSIFGLHKLLRRLPGWASRLQRLLAMVSFRIERLADKSAEPINRINTLASRIDTILHPRRVFKR